MAHVLSLPDGSTHSCLSEKDAFDLVEKYMGGEFLDYLKEIIEETTYLVQDQAEEDYGELKDQYDTLREQYEALKEQYEDLQYERGRW